MKIRSLWAPTNIVLTSKYNVSEVQVYLMVDFQLIENRIQFNFTIETVAHLKLLDIFLLVYNMYFVAFSFAKIQQALYCLQYLFTLYISSIVQNKNKN